MPEPADDHGHRAVYDRSAPGWSSLRSASTIEEPWLGWLTAGFAPRAAVLDLGCGTGQPVAAWLISRGFTVTGVDFAPAMIAAARAVLPQARWITADMRALPDMGRFDAVIAWDSLFHLGAGQQRQVLRDLVARLRPGGRLCFTSGPEEGEVWGAVSGGPVWHASLAPQGYVDLLAPLGMRLRRFVAEDPAVLGRTVWLWQSSAAVAD